MCIRFTVPEMIRAGGGAIVNVSSGAGRRGLPFRIGYCSAKAGQSGHDVTGWALELAPHNITVNCVAPGAIEGDRIDRVIEGQAKQRGLTPEAMRTMMLERSPLKAHGDGRGHRRRRRVPSRAQPRAISRGRSSLSTPASRRARAMIRAHLRECGAAQARAALRSSKLAAGARRQARHVGGQHDQVEAAL